MTVTRFEGAETATLPNAFTYDPEPLPPQITAITPASGPVTGGTDVTITGNYFPTLGTEVRLVRIGTRQPRVLTPERGCSGRELPAWPEADPQEGLC
mgnify:CR=1 FL=1